MSTNINSEKDKEFQKWISNTENIENKEKETLNNENSTNVENKNEINSIDETNKEEEKKEEKKKWWLWTLILSAIGIKFLFSFLMAAGFFMLIMNFISVLPGTFLPKNTSSTIAFYQADSFFGIPVNYRDDAWTIPEIATPVSTKKLDEMEGKITKTMQDRLDEKFGSWTYAVKFFRDDKYYDSNWKETYMNLNNITQQMENIFTFWVEIKKTAEWAKWIEERIYFYSTLRDDVWFMDKLASKFGNNSAFVSWYKDPLTPNWEGSIYFLKNINDAETIWQNFLEFVKLIQSGKGNDWQDKWETKEAFQFLLWKEWEEYNELVNTTIDFYPYFSENFKDWWVDSIWTNGCAIKYTVSEKEQLDCAEGTVKIRIADAGWVAYPKEYFRDKSFKIKNVVMSGPEKVRTEMRNYANILTKYNQIRLHKSYFVDMMNFVGAAPGNSNQKVLSKERINLEYFSKKNLGKTPSTIVLNPVDVQKFTPLDARKILDMPAEWDVQDSTFIVKNWEQNKEYEIYKNNGGFSTDRVVSSCTWLPIVYPDIDSVIHGFQYNEQVGKCIDSAFKPALLKIWEVKYYKKFHFVWDKKDEKSTFTKIVEKVDTLKDKLQWNTTNQNEGKVVTRKRDEYKLNYFYHFTEPTSISSSTKLWALWEGSYISDIGLDNKTILWNGIYIKAKSYWLIAAEKDGTFDVVRDSRDGTPLFENLPIEFEIGLLTSLDDVIIETVEENGKIVMKERKNEIVSTFDDVNKKFATGKNYEENFGWWWTLYNNLVWPKNKYLHNKSLEENWEPYNTLFSKFSNKQHSALDGIRLREWKNDEFLTEFAAPTFIRKWNENYLNRYFNDSDKQRKFMELLDTIYYQKNWDKYTFTPEAVIDKYLVLFGHLPEDLAESYSYKYGTWDKKDAPKNDSITNFMCKDYTLPSYVSDLYIKKTFENERIVYNTFNSAIVKNQWTMFENCLSSYFWQVVLSASERKLMDEISNVITEDDINKNKVLEYLDLGNSNHKIFPSIYLFDKERNDLYFLYLQLKEKGINELTYLNEDWESDKWKLKTYMDLVYFIMDNNGENNDNLFHLTRIKNIADALKKSWNNWDKVEETNMHKPMKEFLSKLNDQQKSFYLYDYRWFETQTVPYKNEKILINNLRLDKNHTHFVNMDNAFSYNNNVYDKETGLHELHINPNVYLYAYFKGMKRDNPTQTVNVRWEDNLWNTPSANFDKFKFDSAVMYNYADNINNNILFDTQLKNFSKIFSWYFWGIGAWSYSSTIKKDLEIMDWFNKNTLNDMVKYWVIERYYRNLPFYKNLWTFTTSPVTDGNSFNMNLIELKKKKDQFEKGGVVPYYNHISFINALENYIPQLDLLLVANSNKAEAEYGSWTITSENRIKTAQQSEEYATYLWSILSWTDPNMAKLKIFNEDYRNIEKLSDSMKYAMNNLAKDLNQTEKNSRLPVYEYLNYKTFWFSFNSVPSWTSWMWWFTSWFVWSWFQGSDAENQSWMDLVGVWDIKPDYNDSMMYGLYRNQEESEKDLDKYIWKYWKLNKWLQEDIWVPYNKNRQYAKVYTIENYIDHSKLKEYFDPILKYDPATDPYRAVAWSGAISETSDKTIIDINTETALWTENSSSNPSTNEDFIAIWKNDTENNQTSTWSVTNSTSTWSWTTTGSGETLTWTGSDLPSFTSTNSINLGGNSAVSSFKKDIEGMSLKNYKVYTNGNINTIDTKRVLRTDINATIDAIAKLEYFPGNGEIEITESLVGITWRPDEASVPENTEEWSSDNTNSDSNTNTSNEASSWSTTNNTSSGTTTENGNNDTTSTGLIDGTWVSWVSTYKDLNRQLTALERVKQCMVFLETWDKNLYEALFRFELKNNTWNVFNMFSYSKPADNLELLGLSYNDKMSIFTFLVENKQFLNCWWLTKDEYKIYLDYVRIKIQEEVESYSAFDEEVIKSYKIYNNISKLKLPDTYTYFWWSGLEARNKASIQATPAYMLQEAMFLNKWNFEWDVRNTYKFVATTKWLGNWHIISDRVNPGSHYMVNIHLNLMINTMLSNQATLYEGLRELSREMYNYSEKLDVSKLTTFSNIDNLWPFYYLYTNNGYMKPENGINFELVDINAMNSGAFGWMSGYDPTLMLMDPSMFASYWEKVWVNAYLDKLSSTYCEQKNWDARIKCKNYMEFLKWMSMESFKQEIEYLTYLIGANKVAGKYVIVWWITAWWSEAQRLSEQVILWQNTFKNSVANKHKDFYNKHMAVLFDGVSRNGSYVWQCTWFSQLYKDYWNSSWHGRDVVNEIKKRNISWVSTDRYSPKNPEHAFKVIQPWDVISFDGYNNRGWCNYWVSYWHVGMVVKTDPAAWTITIAEWNAKNWFQTNVATYKLSNICSWTVAHWVKARYGTSSVVFEKGTDLVSSVNSWTNNSTTTWSGTTTGTWTITTNNPSSQPSNTTPTTPNNSNTNNNWWTITWNNWQ